MRAGHDRRDARCASRDASGRRSVGRRCSGGTTIAVVVVVVVVVRMAPGDAAAAASAANDDDDEDAFAVDFREACVAALSGDASRVRDDASALASASADAGWHAPATPRLVVFPLNARETSAAVEACARRRVCVTPRGAGTGLEGGCVPYAGGCVIDTSRMKAIDVRGVERGDGVARVGAGVLKSELNAALKPLGFVFGPDPSSNPSIGGMASTGGSGLSTLK